MTMRAATSTVLGCAALWPTVGRTPTILDTGSQRPAYAQEDSEARVHRKPLARTLRGPEARIPSTQETQCTQDTGSLLSSERVPRRTEPKPRSTTAGSRDWLGYALVHRDRSVGRLAEEPPESGESTLADGLARHHPERGKTDDDRRHHPGCSGRCTNFLLMYPRHHHPTGSRPVGRTSTRSSLISSLARRFSGIHMTSIFTMNQTASAPSRYLTPAPVSHSWCRGCSSSFTRERTFVTSPGSAAGTARRSAGTRSGVSCCAASWTRPYSIYTCQRIRAATGAGTSYPTAVTSTRPLSNSRTSSATSRVLGRRFHGSWTAFTVAVGRRWRSTESIAPKAPSLKSTTLCSLQSPPVTISRLDSTLSRAP